MDGMNLNEILSNTPPWVAGVIVTCAAALAAMAALGLAIRAMSRRGADDRPDRRRTNVKLEVGFTLVQGVLSYAVVTGVYEFFAHRLLMPTAEAAVLAVFCEAAVWTSVGFIIEHGRSMIEVHKDGVTERKPATGWGLGGPFFWIFSGAGGTLAILGAATTVIAVGRIVVVIVGTALWVLRLMRATRRGGQRSRFRWTPSRLMIAFGLLEPEPEGEVDENRAWKIARLARAIRWSNSRVFGRGTPLAWWGGRSLAAMAESTTEEVLRGAQMRCAAAFVLREQAAYDSDVMRAMIAAAKSTATEVAELTNRQAVQAARAALGVDTRVRQPEVPDEIRGDAHSTVGRGLATERAGTPRPLDAGTARGSGPGPATDRAVRSLADQLSKDRVAARLIVEAVEALTGEQYDSWSTIREAIGAKKLLNQVSARSGLGKPRIGRILPRAEELYDLCELAEAVGA